METDKNTAVEAERYEEASRIRDEIADTQHRIDEAASHGGGDLTIDEADIAEVISRATGIPANRITEGRARASRWS